MVIEMFSKDDIRFMLKSINIRFPTDLKKGEIFNAMNWTNESWNLGDVLFLTIIPPKAQAHCKKMYVYSQSVFFEPIMSFNDYYHRSNDLNLEHYNGLHILHNDDYGNGHWLQCQCRGMGFDIDIKPKPYINFKCEKKKNTVLINIEGHSYHHLTEIITPIIQKFVDENSNDFHFVETFNKQSDPHIKNIEFFQLPVEEMIKKVGTFEYFIGLDSGLMHISAALDVKSVIITDKPKVGRLYLPKPNGNYNDFIGISYLYPQNVHLHLDGENQLVKQLSVENLKRALNGDLYPYWREDYLDLILEF